MLTRQCDIFILGSNGIKRLCTYRRWMLFLPLTLIAVSLAVNVFLWKYYAGYGSLAAKVSESGKVLVEQKAEAYRLKEKMAAAETEVKRISSFNEKLGVMVNFDVEKETSAAVGVGSPGPPRASALDQPLPGSVGVGRRMNSLIEYLTSEISLQEVLQQDLRNSLRERKLEFEARPSLWPLKGRISSGFGFRRSPFGGKGDFHRGVDIRVPTGTSVHAPGAGKVIEVGYMSGYGLRVVLEHDFGVQTVFGHLRKSLVKEGQTVKRGQKIALSGNSGRSTGPHLHYEVHVQAKAVNPMKFMLD
jgi:murein DD-endopeptidase MepM/ murein hydrolase activator NlpD